jgi:hypothetical protein
MDQDLYDIDPEYRKKYDTDMQKRVEAQEARRADIQKTKASLRTDVLSLSNDDFGSKYGRDRTAKEVAIKDANDKAGYKEAEAENKREKAMSRTSGGGGGGMPSDKMDKMKKMNYKAGGKVSSASKRADGIAIRGKTRA